MGDCNTIDFVFSDSFNFDSMIKLKYLLAFILLVTPAFALTCTTYSKLRNIPVGCSENEYMYDWDEDGKYCASWESLNITLNATTNCTACDTIFLKLDASNDPLSGDLDIADSFNLNMGQNSDVNMGVFSDINMKSGTIYHNASVGYIVLDVIGITGNSSSILSNTGLFILYDNDGHPVFAQGADVGGQVIGNFEGTGDSIGTKFTKWVANDRDDGYIIIFLTEDISAYVQHAPSENGTAVFSIMNHTAEGEGTEGYFNFYDPNYSSIFGDAFYGLSLGSGDWTFSTPTEGGSFVIFSDRNENTAFVVNHTDNYRVQIGNALEILNSTATPYPQLTVGGTRTRFSTDFSGIYGLGVRPVVYAVADGLWEAGVGGGASSVASYGVWGVSSNNGNAGAFVSTTANAYGTTFDTCSFTGSSCHDNRPSIDAVGCVEISDSEDTTLFGGELCFGSNACVGDNKCIIHDATNFHVTDDLYADLSFHANDYYSGDGSQGITNTTGFWMCTDAACTGTCSVIVKDGLITGCV